MFAKKIFTLAVVMLSFYTLSSFATAASIFVDFGDSAQITAGNYNNLTFNSPSVLSIPNAVDSTGAGTGISIAASGFYPGSNQNGATAPTGAAAVFDPQATRDNAFGHTGAFGGNPDASLATVSLAGLNPAVTYDFVFFGSRTSVTDNRETAFAVSGATTSTAYLNTAANTSNVAVVTGIAPTASGTIAINVSAGPNNNNASKFYYLGAMRIDTVVPEPGLIGLVGIGLAAACLRRSGKCRS